METTVLTLLARDGMLRVTLTPMLPAAKYADLSDIMVTGRDHTRAQFREALMRLADAWGAEVEVENLRQ